MGGLGSEEEVPWAGLFCGRESELSRLAAAFERVAAGKGPEVVVILGESGLGKTRLVQEFFTRLSSRNHVAGETAYWPDRMSRSGNNLAINPDPALCNPSNLAQMDFLWWGIRMLDRQGHNAGLGGVRDTVGYLRAHIEPFANAKLLRGRMKDATKGAVMDVAVEVANLFTFGLAGLGKLGIDHAREWKGILEERSGAEGSAPADEAARQRESLIDLTLRDLGMLFEDNEEKGAHLPAVILLDDAQWLAADESSLVFTERLLDRAKAESWPLLLVATHWQKEWREDLGDPAKASLAQLLRDWSRARKTEIELGREPDLGLMIEAGFPGLTNEQTRLLLEKAGGNPRLLDEMLRYLQRKKALFDQRDTGRPLTENGMARLGDATFALHDLVADRLSQAPEAVRCAVGLASLQGERFLDTLVSMTAQSVSQEEPDHGLSQAERPHSFVSRLAKGQSEFAQRVFMDVAREQLEDIIEPEAALEALRQTLVVFAGENAAFKRLDPGDRDLARQVAIYVLSAFDGELTQTERHCLADCYEESAQQAYTGDNDALRAHEFTRRAIAAIRGGALAVTDFSTRALTTFSSLLASTGDGEARVMMSDVVIRRLESSADDSARHLADLADAYSTRARILLDLEGTEDAVSWSRKAVEFSRKAEAASDDLKFKRALFFRLSEQLEIEEDRNGFGSAPEIQEECGKIIFELKEKHASLLHLDLYASHVGGMVMTALVRDGAEAALPMARKAVETAREYLAAAGIDPSRLPKAEFQVASQRRWLAAVLHSLDRHEESVEELEAACAALERVWEEYQQLYVQDALIDGLSMLGVYRKHAGRSLEEAILPIERAMEMARVVRSATGGRQSGLRVAKVAMILGRAYALDGQIEKGLAVLHEAESSFVDDIEATGSHHNLNPLLRVRCSIAEFLAESGRQTDALDLLVRTREDFSGQAAHGDRGLRDRMDEVIRMIGQLQQ